MRAALARLGRAERRLARLPAAADAARVAALLADPARLLADAGLDPDPWQSQLLRAGASRMLLLCSRQAGKSTAAAALALQAAWSDPGRPVLLLAPAERQSKELFRKALAIDDALGRPVRRTRLTRLTAEYANGSRLAALPGKEGTVRGFSGVSLLVIDEAARVPDALYCAVRPMLAVSGGRLAALSTPFGKRGWFHDEWHAAEAWHRVRVAAADCPRIPAAFLEQERRSMGPRWFKQEFECSFEANADAVFSYEDIAAAFSDDVKPLFPG